MDGTGPCAHCMDAEKRNQPSMDIEVEESSEEEDSDED